MPPLLAISVAHTDPWTAPAPQTNGFPSQNGTSSGGAGATLDDAFDLISNRQATSSPGTTLAPNNNGVNQLDIFGLFHFTLFLFKLVPSF